MADDQAVQNQKTQNCSKYLQEPLEGSRKVQETQTPRKSVFQVQLWIILITGPLRPMLPTRIGVRSRFPSAGLRGA